VIAKRGTIDVSALLREGKIATLRVARWRAQQRIRPVDVGLGNLDPVHLQQYMKLGSKTLIPPALQNKLRSLEGSARYVLERYSLDTPFGRFVPAAAFETLDDEMNRVEAEWFQMRDELCDHMREHIDEVRANYRELAGQVYAELKTQAIDKDDYARHFATRIIKGVPDVEEIRASFEFDFQVFDVAMPTVLEQKIRQQILEEEASLEQLKTIREAEQRVRGMNERIASRFERTKEEKVDKFVNDVNTQVRTMVFEVAASAKESLKKNHSLVGKTGAQLKAMIARFRMLNVLNDKEIDKQLTDVEKMLAVKGKKNTKELVGALTDLRQEARNMSLDLKAPVQRTVREELLGDVISGHGIGIPQGRRVSHG
jgi:hypothetical protein